ncbi:enoyl-CoA hydratase/carnithine racemase [Bradyrhizobium elkanii]
MALAADMRFATPGSKFDIPATKLGSGYQDGGLTRLPRLIGPSRTRDIMYITRFVEPDEALRIGLINFVMEDKRLD